VITIGMAVDANVLICERIREEMRWGASPKQAIIAGYDRAYNTILDSNLTTFLVAFILFAIGTGPIKGFAVTLMIGIICSMFTAITVTRAIVQLVYGRKRNLNKLSI
jgi:preprotein translocase subunit SecD